MVASDHEFASAARHRRFGQAENVKHRPLEPQKTLAKIYWLNF
jgi:hypothetical protein